MTRLLAIDPSLTCSGWALFSLKEEKLVGVGKIRAMGPEHTLAHRLLELQTRVRNLFAELQLTETDIVVCEAPTTMKDPRSAIRVEQVRSIFEAEARTKGAEVPGRLNPRTVQREVLGLSGKQMVRKEVKHTACEIAFYLYGARFKEFGIASVAHELSRHQDVVDAVLVGHTALSRIRSAHLSAQPLPLFFLERRERAS